MYPQICVPRIFYTKSILIVVFFISSKPSIYRDATVGRPKSLEKDLEVKKMVFQIGCIFLYKIRCYGKIGEQI